MVTATRTDRLSYLTEQVNELKAKGTHFRLRVLDDEQAPVCTFDGKKVINLASNNYLGLTTHPKLREASQPLNLEGRLPDNGIRLFDLLHNVANIGTVRKR